MDKESKCIYCEKDSSDEEPLCQIGLWFKEGSDKKHPIDALLEYATKLRLDNVVAKINEHKLQNIPSFSHNKCRVSLTNQCRKRISDTESEPITTTLKTTRRSESVSFDFKKQCFYCGKSCSYDYKHPDRSDIEQVGRKDTKIYVHKLHLCKLIEDGNSKATKIYVHKLHLCKLREDDNSKDTKSYVHKLHLCKLREDGNSKAIERRLLGVCDFVAAEERYHKSCRSTFENPPRKYPA